jgi:S-DNA-T family DNA segregation ATPase FtsK/SpoIIIE
MADILRQTAGVLPGEDRLRAQIAEIQRILLEQETPARIVDARPMASRVLFIARPEIIGKRSARRPVTPAEIRRSLSAIAEQHPEWTLGFIQQMPDDPDSVGILLRTEQHQPLHLRQVLISNAYMHSASTLALVVGVTIEQQVIVRDLAAVGHLLIAGSETARPHIVRTILVTLALFNTPAELRLTLVGTGSAAYQDITGVPHMLGRLIAEPERGGRLLEGMSKEVQRRWQWFQEHNVSTLSAYNEQLQRANQPPLPRIVVLLDAFADEAWMNGPDSWIESAYDLLVNGARVGVHVLCTADQPERVPEPLAGVLASQIVMRSVRPDLAADLKNVHTSALRFADAFFIENERSPVVLPVELCTVAPEETQRLVAYWRGIATQRAREITARERTGLTDLLPDLAGSDLAERPAAPPLPTRTRAGTLVRATQALASPDENLVLQRAQALAAYLGWIGPGPLHDILGLSTGEARAVIAALQNLELVEAGDAPVLRFVRLADNPLAADSSG